MNGAQHRRLVEIELAVARLTAPRSASRDDLIDETAVLAAWAEIMADPPPARPLPPDLAAMTDDQCLDEWRRTIKRGPR